jgi:DNA-binding NarL/FixJ family response regulator
VLSCAERRVLSLVAEGGSNNDVAAQLMVSEATVRKHLEHTYRKLGVANRTAAAALMRDSAVG